MLVGAIVGFDEALGVLVLGGGEDGVLVRMYPGVVEFCLEADVLAFFLVLCAQDLEFIGLQG